MVCPDGFLKCGEGHCIPLQRVCDGTADCFKGEDEAACGEYRLGSVPSVGRCVPSESTGWVLYLQWGGVYRRRVPAGLCTFGGAVCTIGEYWLGSVQVVGTSS